jgi:hypothetical protein
MALHDEERPTKPLRVTSAYFAGRDNSSSQLVDDIRPAMDSSSSFIRPQGSQLDVSSVAPFSIPPTPRTPPQQTAFSLPHLNEFDAGLSPLQTGASPEQSKAQLRPPPRLISGPRMTPPPPPLAKMGAYYVPFTEESLGAVGILAGLPSRCPKKGSECRQRSKSG